MDFSAEALPISMKFCMAVQPHLRQAFSYFGGIAVGIAELWASTGTIWWDMLLAEALVVVFTSSVTNWPMMIDRGELIISNNRYCLLLLLILSVCCLLIFGLNWW